MRAFVIVYLRQLAGYRLRATVTVLVLAMAIGLALAVAAVNSSVTASTNDHERALVGNADVAALAATDSGMDEDVARRLSDVPGVEAVAPMVRTTVVVARKQTTLVGVDRSARRFAAGFDTRGLEKTLQRPTRLPPVVIGAALARHGGITTGRDLDVYVDGAVRRATVVRILNTHAINDGYFIGALLPSAQALTGQPGRIDEVLLRAPGDAHPAIERALDGRAVLQSRSELVAQQLVGVAVLKQTLPLLAAVVLVVGAFLVFNTIGMATREQMWALAVVRTLGATKRRILIGVLGQAAVLAVIGTAIGVTGGFFMARAILSSVPVTLLSSVPTEIRLKVSALDVASATVAGLAAALVAAFVAARRLVNVSPVDAVRSAPADDAMIKLERIRSPLLAVAGVVLAAGGVVAIVLGPTTLPLLGAALLIGGWVMGTYGVSGWMASSTASLVERLGVAGRVAAGGIRRAPRRIWATATGISVAIGVVVGLSGSGANSLHSAQPTFASIAKTGFLAQTAQANALPTAILMPAAWESQLARLPGVASVRPVQFGYITIGGRRVMLQGTTPSSTTPLVYGAGPTALRPGRVVISTQLAKAEGLRTGSRLDVPTPTGSRQVTVAAVERSFLWPNGVIAFDIDDVRSWFRRPGANAYEIQLAPGATPSVVRAEVGKVLAQAPIPGYVVSGAESYAAATQTIKQASQMFTALGSAGLLVAALMTLGTLAISVLERRREFGVLRAVGASRRHLRRTVFLEACGIVLLGLIVGVPLGLLFQDLSALVNRESLGLPVDFQLAPRTLVAAGVACALMSIIGGLAPIVRIGRLDVVEALRDE